MTKSDLWKKRFSSFPFQRVRGPSGGEAQQQASGMAPGAGGQELTSSLQAQSESHWVAGQGCLLSKPVPGSTLPLARPFMPPNPPTCTSWGPKILVPKPLEDTSHLSHHTHNPLMCLTLTPHSDNLSFCFLFVNTHYSQYVPFVLCS